MSEWTETTLGDVAEITSGPAFKSAVFRDAKDGPRLLRGMNLGPDGPRWPEDETYLWPESLRGAYGKYELLPGDVCIAMDATFTRGGQIRGGAIRDIDLPALLVQRVARLRSRSVHCLPGFLLAIVRSTALREHLSDRQTGAFAPHISQRDLVTYRFLLPPLPEQRRIVDVVAAVDAQIEALVTEVERADNAYRNASNLLWLDEDGTEAPLRSLGDVMRLAIERVPLDADTTYSSAGVLGAGQGLIDKGSFLGSETEYGAMNVLRTGQVVMRKLTAWEGPITVVPQSFDGYVASNEFPTFTLSGDVSPTWMRHVCRTTRLWGEMKNRVTGSVQRRKRLSPQQLLAVGLPIPSRDDQERVAAGLDALDAQVEALRDELAHIRKFRSTLLDALLRQEVEMLESYDSLLEGAAVAEVAS